MSTDVAWYYNPARNPDGAALIGVPLRDLTEADMDDMPAHTVKSIDESPLYRKTKPPAIKPDTEETPAAARQKLAPLVYTTTTKSADTEHEGKVS